MEGKSGSNLLVPEIVKPYTNSLVERIPTWRVDAGETTWIGEGYGYIYAYANPERSYPVARVERGKVSAL